MAKLNQAVLENLEKLCCLKWSDTEKDQILLSLQKVLDYVELLQELDTEKVAPTSHVLGSLMKHLLREDETTRVMPTQDFFQNVPESIAGMVRIPPVRGEEN